MIRSRQRGFTLVEIMVAVVILGMLIVGMSSIIENSIQSRDYVAARSELTREAEFALDRIVRTVSHSRKLLLPLVDKTLSNWPENIREQTVPPSPAVGDSTLATAVLAVTLPLFNDLDFDGFPDADNDRDGRVDEDRSGDLGNDGASGLYLIDDGGDGTVDEHQTNDDDEYFNQADEDPENGIDDDNDFNVDEDPGSDVNGDGCAGVCGVDDDGNGLIDEGAALDDDEDASVNEDWYDAVVYYLEPTGELVERLPVPWDENGVGGIDGRDFVLSTLAANVSRLRFERLADGTTRAELIDITVELTSPVAGTVSLNSRVRVGGAL